MIMMRKIGGRRGLQINCSSDEGWAQYSFHKVGGRERHAEKLTDFKPMTHSAYL
jgi:hypothetical protein